MKKIFSLLITISVILSGFSMVNFAYAEDNIVFFHSFSDGQGDCVPVSAKTGDKIELVNDSVLGKQVMKVLDDSDSLSSGIKSPKIPVEGGRSYTYTANIKIESGTVKLYVKYYDESSKQIESKSANAKVGAYSIVSMNYVAPANAAFAEILVSTVSTTLGEGYVEYFKIIEGQKINVTEKVMKVKDSTDANVRRFSVIDGTENYTINGIDTGVSIKDGYMCQSAIPTASLEIVPETPIKIDNLSMKIKYKLKAESKGKISYLGLYFFGDGGKKGTGLYVFSFPVSGRWYEGEIKLMDAGQVGARGTFEPGDVIENFRITIGNNSGVNVDGIFEYVEFVSGQEDIWGTPSGQDVLDKVAADVSNAKPGDTVIIPDGTYTGVKFNIEGHGSENNPITIKAQTPGKVIINGLSSMTVNGEHLVIDGLFFHKAWNPVIVNIPATSHHIRVTNTAMVDCNNPNRATKAVWFQVGGQYNRVDHCFFNHKINHGVLFSVVRDSEPNYFQIDHNYFGNFEASVVGNGAETIRAGSGTASYVDSNTVYEYNFFEKCDGEGELISLKAANCDVRYNTLYNSTGGICLRAGDNNRVYGNVIHKTMGIRVIGINQVVRDNYISQCLDMGIALESGTDPNDAQYTPVKNAKVTNNTTDASAIAVGINQGITSQANMATTAYPRKYSPEGIYKNNLSVTYSDKDIVAELAPAAEFKIENNAQIGGIKSTKDGISHNNVSVLKDKNGFFYTNNGVGADIEEISKAPLDPKNILADWILKKVEANEEGFVIGKVQLSSGEENEVGIILNGERLVSDVPPQIIDGRTLVPLRAIFEAMDATLNWDDATKTATATRGDLTISLTSNSKTAYVNGEAKELDVPATIIDGRFVVPARFISETMGAKVGWVAETRTVVIDGGSVKYPVKNEIPNALPVYDAIQSSDDGTGKTISGVLDGAMGSKWGVLYDANNPDGAYGIFDLGSSIDIDGIWIAFAAGNARVYTIDIYTSDDGENYTLHKAGYKSSGETTDFEKFEIGKKARFIKIVGKGNTVNGWMNIQEVAITKK